MSGDEVAGAVDFDVVDALAADFFDAGYLVPLHPRGVQGHPEGDRRGSPGVRVFNDGDLHAGFELADFGPLGYSLADGDVLGFEPVVKSVFEFIEHGLTP